MSVHAHPSNADTAVDATVSPRPRLILTVLGLCGIVVALMQTLVVPIIPQLPSLLNASPADTSWAITATLLAAAVITPISGRLGDMFGKKRMILVSLGLVVLGSVICALSSSLIVLVIGRALQGASVGAIPLGIAILRDVLPPKKVGGAMAVMSATLGVGGAVGLPIAALIAQSADWHFLFVVSAALGCLCMLLVFFVIPESSVRKPGRFDFVGALGLAAALIALLLPITKGGTWGWTDPKTLGLLASSVVIFVAWGFWELRRSAPLVNLRIAARKQVLFTNLASIAIGFSMYGNSLSLPQLLMAPKDTGYGFGLSMVTTGLVLAPAGLVMMALSPVSARISDWKGPRITLLTGSLVIGLGYVAALFATSAVWQVALAGMVIGAGVGLTFSAMPALIMSSVPITESAAANGLNSLMRSIGTSSSAAVVSVVLAGATIMVHDRVYPTLDMFKATFVISIVAAAVAMIFAWLIPKRKAPHRESTTSRPQE
ncbi:MFS transporter [Rhodococcus sp. MS16]|uniref:EmrB/QacA subfamily drug resistance transporter n=1 Tax=Nocardia globerula TaxID=1818 RepID=A0A652YSQ4_NOCGL|nr:MULTISPECIES: MFS transporter [Rhodococcus]NMD61541.1 MFS transporter [Nocardia globerula]NRI69014.1 MFS transporter [Rhodococcus sp. MS16]PVX66907.1 EmrB/QacA subfamily drug resistance transporter [Rhodococcus globerulus]RZL27006.1 MAG: MFS transporter [Rhodococcus sp. (in: high G+C Gram-positive bacteria)]